jgi:SRSO17 transposase
MLKGRRKSMQPMAERLEVDHQRLQQFVTSSPWDVVERARPPMNITARNGRWRTR